MTCLLCKNSQPESFAVRLTPARDYRHCANCDLIFMEPSQRLSLDQEKARYDEHENNDSPGYRQFLVPVLSGLAKWLKAAPSTDPEILDYGCGPTALLAEFAPEFRFEKYDPFYFPNSKALQKTYPLIVSTEVFEHFHRPLQEIEKLFSLLKSQGILAVMTAAHPGVEAFANWSYRRDMTHVIFFSEKTMNYLLTLFPWQKVTFQNPLWVFQKGPEA